MKILLIAFFGFLLSGNQVWSQCADDANIFSFTFNNIDYEVVKEMKNWSDASACAVERGGHLVEIDDLNEQNAVFNGINNAGVSPTYTSVANGGGIAYVWIGGTDQDTEGTWLWDGNNDNTGINFWSGQGANGSGNGSAENNLYNNWGGKSTGTNNEPDDFGQGQDYAAIGLEGWPSGTTNLGIAGEWNDIDGSSSLYFVIEKDNTVGTNSFNQPEVKIYPNPTSDKLFVDNTDISGKTQFEIYDLTGKILAKGLLNDNNEINTKRLNQGIYYLKIENQHFTEFIKFVKQ